MNMKMEIDGIVTNIEKKLQARSLKIKIIGGNLEGYGYYISDINTVVYNENLIGKDEQANYDYLNDLLNSLHKYIIKYSPTPKKIL
ncbi:hypothetical protein [Ligilactobacillus hayakitensis]|uniref:hypothetical protein n=1 Tax=Ligilactobacillus hayakitensis TaxID=396716 RepID=UPI000469267F|nr:hypothetical protein [Ligilactobacillus hayakitensis]